MKGSMKKKHLFLLRLTNKINGLRERVDQKGALIQNTGIKMMVLSMSTKKRGWTANGMAWMKDRMNITMHFQM